VSKGPFALIAGLALLAGACASTATATSVDLNSSFVPMVADTLDNVGLGSAVAVDSGGLPYVTYFGFPGVVAKGQIAIPRPIGSPYVPGVLLTTMTQQGIWLHGAIDQTKPAAVPSGVNIPFGPVSTAKLPLTEDNANGTAIALASDGTVNAAWTMGGVVDYGTTKLGGTSTVEQVFSTGANVKTAGPVSAPGIALDKDGNPWIAFSVLTNAGVGVRVATKSGDTWKVQTVATTTPCDGCVAPGPTAIVAPGGAPQVLFADGEKHAVEAATLKGGTWVVADVETGVSGTGLSASTTGAKAYAAYYTGSAVHVATFASGAWKTAEAGTGTDPDPSAVGTAASRTAVAADDKTVYVAWDDKDEGVQLVSGTDSFSPVTTSGTSGGEHPSLAVGSRGTILSWYNPTTENLMVGVLGDNSDILLANPSPSFTVSIAPPANLTCGKDKKVSLDEIAKNIQFQSTCLVAAAGGSFTIDFDNEDVATQHNIAIFTNSSATQNLFRGQITTGPNKVTYDVKTLAAGTYYFHCDVHPTQMQGTLAVVTGAK
jgi:plastocyanin